VLENLHFCFFLKNREFLIEKKRRRRRIQEREREFFQFSMMMMMMMTPLFMMNIYRKIKRRREF